MNTVDDIRKANELNHFSMPGFLHSFSNSIKKMGDETLLL